MCETQRRKLRHKRWHFRSCDTFGDVQSLMPHDSVEKFGHIAPTGIEGIALSRRYFLLHLYDALQVLVVSTCTYFAIEVPARNAIRGLRRIHPLRYSRDVARLPAAICRCHLPLEACVEQSKNFRRHW